MRNKSAKEPSAREALQPEAPVGLQAASLKDNYSEMIDNNPISINYSDDKLRILVEEYIIQQRTSFTLKGVCSYVLYWAMEDGKANQSNNSLYEGNTICQNDCDRISSVLSKIVGEGRIAAVKNDSFCKTLN